MAENEANTNAKLQVSTWLAAENNRHYMTVCVWMIIKAEVNICTAWFRTISINIWPFFVLQRTIC